MKIRFDFKKECYCIDLKRAIIFSAMFLAVGMLTAFCSGSTYIYITLLLPNFALGRGVFVVLWTLFYITFGFTLEIILSTRCVLHKEKLVCLFIFTVALGYLWFPFFFGANAFFLSFLICVMISVMTFVTLKKFLRINKLVSVIMGVYFVWLLYCCALNFCICLLN
ncbi:MAG: tryptophan-rich sensory protein [Ruminococcaceae bacterium]|nr:tryptophan-rich sensory protein [Oscillospiraceae bacterium]